MKIMLFSTLFFLYISECKAITLLTGNELVRINKNTSLIWVENGRENAVNIEVWVSTGEDVFKVDKRYLIDLPKNLIQSQERVLIKITTEDTPHRTPKKLNILETMKSAKTRLTSLNID